MPLIGLLVFFGLEFWVMSLIAGETGWGVVIGLVIGSGMIGLGLVRFHARRLQAGVQRALLKSGADMPSRMAEMFAPIAAGMFLTVPGFITDVIGLTLLLPPLRPMWGRALGQVLARAARRGATRTFTFGGAPGASDNLMDGLRGLDLSGGGASPPRGRRGDEKVVDADYEVLD